MGNNVSLTPPPSRGMTDVPSSLDGRLINCCDSNLSRSGRLCLHRVYQTVRHNSTRFFPALTFGRLSDAISLRGNSRVEWKATNTAPTTISPLSHMEIAINRTYDQDQIPQTSQFGSFISVEGQSCGKPSSEPEFDENAKNGVGVSNTIAVA